MKICSRKTEIVVSFKTCSINLCFITVKDVLFSANSDETVQETDLNDSLTKRTDPALTINKAITHKNNTEKAQITTPVKRNNQDK